tara:strand:- start:543 stop:962 length:420 start_codon:yes stop_codon:yes gene_type:complete
MALPQVGVSFQARDNSKSRNFYDVITLIDYGFTSFIGLFNAVKDPTSDLFASAVDAMILIKRDCTNITIWCQGNDPDMLQPYADTIMSTLNFQHQRAYSEEYDNITLELDHPTSECNIGDLSKVLAMDFDAIKAELDSR